ncbi:hypothetical protein ACISSW_28175, partial [Escherichia coli]
YSVFFFLKKKGPKEFLGGPWGGELCKRQVVGPQKTGKQIMQKNALKQKSKNLRLGFPTQ